MPFSTDLAAKLIEYLQPKLDDEDFQGLLTIIEDNFEIDEADKTPAVTAMDRAIEHARRNPRPASGRPRAKPMSAKASAEFAERFPEAGRLVRS